MDARSLERLCSAWPGATSSIKWDDDMVFSVCNKMFVVLCIEGPDRGRISFKVEPERFLELSDQPGMAPAPYMARAFWISMVEPQRFADTVLADFVRQSYRMVRAGLSKKLQATLAAGPE